MPEPTPGQVAYEAYWRFLAHAAPSLTAHWETASPLHQAAWEAAAQAVLDAWQAQPRLETPAP